MSHWNLKICGFFPLNKTKYLLKKKNPACNPTNFTEKEQSLWNQQDILDFEVL